MNEYSHDDLADVAVTLGERLKLQPAALPLDVFDARRQLQDYLTGVLTEMLDKGSSRLMPMFYRLDIAEAKVEEIIRALPPPAVPAALADLIIDRQLAKARTQRLYREGRL